MASDTDLEFGYRIAAIELFIFYAMISFIFYAILNNDKIITFIAYLPYNLNLLVLILPIILTVCVALASFWFGKIMASVTKGILQKYSKKLTVIATRHKKKLTIALGIIAFILGSLIARAVGISWSTIVFSFIVIVLGLIGKLVIDVLKKR